MNGNYSGTLPTDCYSCHTAAWQSTTTLGGSVPNHITSGYPTTCASCHTTTSWLGAIFNHNTTGFPLTGAHTTVACNLCHTTSNPPPTDCYSCHTAEWQSTATLGGSVPNHLAATRLSRLIQHVLDLPHHHELAGCDVHSHPGGESTATRRHLRHLPYEPWLGHELRGVRLHQRMPYAIRSSQMNSGRTTRATTAPYLYSTGMPPAMASRGTKTKMWRWRVEVAPCARNALFTAQAAQYAQTQPAPANPPAPPPLMRRKPSSYCPGSAQRPIHRQRTLPQRQQIFFT